MLIRIIFRKIYVFILTKFLEIIKKNKIYYIERIKNLIKNKYHIKFHFRN